MDLDVATRWNATYAMIKKLLRVEQAYNETCEHFSELEQYKVSAEHSYYLKEVVELLQNFEDMTKELECTKLV